ncbi:MULTISPECIES: ABC transporter ATP-binding protein [unclassified Bradyrhizobium]|uniref:ABC transporter ATP-binding protein n=1 Tax=unclassified Bradyrhizobium TaxID=2631580 RepID=UPI0028E1B301|nr:MULTISPECIES: ABC transporter ATP-binding protein [unclassified Bradyrhizobium]
MLTPASSARSASSVTFEHVFIEFPIYSAHGRSIKRSVLQYTTGGRIGVGSNQRVVVSSLNDVSLIAEHGERIGLIGHNGAGKSTMLRAVSGVYEPVRGSITVCGRVASLIDLTLGMDLEASGYENIRIRCMLLGLTSEEIAHQINDIAEVTELGDFLEMPIRTYSSGMMLRLAFAISTSITPDILLMDEWIGAGDASFIKKAQARLQDLLGRTGILFIASHSEDIVKSNCTRAVWLEKGAIRVDGTPSEVWREYQAWSTR